MHCATSQRFPSFLRYLFYSLSTLIKHEIDNSCVTAYGFAGCGRSADGSLRSQPNRERGGYFPQKEKGVPPQKRLPVGPIQEKRLRLPKSLKKKQRAQKAVVSLFNTCNRFFCLLPLPDPVRFADELFVTADEAVCQKVEDQRSQNSPETRQKRTLIVGVAVALAIYQNVVQYHAHRGC